MTGLSAFAAHILAGARPRALPRPSFPAQDDKTFLLRLVDGAASSTSVVALRGAVADPPLFVFVRSARSTSIDMSIDG